MEKTGVVTIKVDKHNKNLEKTADDKSKQACSHPRTSVTISSDGTVFCKDCGCYLEHE